jgi:hypothetical protein
MNIRRSLSLSLLLAVVAAPTVIGCAGETSLEGAASDEGDVATQQSAATAAAAAAAAGSVDPGLLASGAALAAAPTYTNDLTPAFAEAAAADPNAPAVQQTSAGEGWRVMHVKGKVADAKTGVPDDVDDDIIILESKEALDTAPLGPKTRAELKMVSSLRSSKAAAAHAAGPKGLAPSAAGAAKGEPLEKAVPEADAEADGESLFTVVHKKHMDAVENPPPAPAGAMFFSFCDDYDGQYSKSLSVDKAYNFHKGDETGAFTGAFDVSARIQANATATIKYRAKTSVLAACKAVWIDFKKAIVQGNADLTATGNVDAQFLKEWHYKKTIASPTVFDNWFTIGVVPVHLRVMVPVEAGLDAAAKATLKANAKVVGHGAFNVTCGSSSCSGSKSATLAFDENNPPTFEAQLRVKVTPWAQASLKAVLFDETIGGYGQVGVRASLPTDLWAYAGNTCGDGDGNGSNEIVTAGTLDMAAKIDIVAKAGAFGSDIGPWTWNVVNKHLVFKTFGDSTAIDPIFTSEATGVARRARMHGRMRPCWPYADAVTYRITWSDGTFSSFTAAPGAVFTQQHDFASPGLKPIKLEALYDAAGRNLGGETTRKLYMRPFDLPDLTPVEGVFSLN